MPRSELERLLAKYPNPRDVRGARMLERSGDHNYLTRDYPKTSGFLEAALMGTAPDEMEGSVLDPITAERRAGAEAGYPIGIAAQVAPMLSPLSRFVKGVAMAPNVTRGSQMAQRGVIKAPGGNWLAGSVEDSLRGLKRDAVGRDPAKRSEEIRREIEGLGHGVDPTTGVDLDVVRGHYQRELDRMRPDTALNAWIDKQLTRYVQKDMATEKDPIRALAERGITHDPSVGEMLGRNFVHPTGEHYEKLAKNPMAQGWENASDNMLRETPMSEYQNFGSSNLTASEPWLQKLDPSTPMYRPKDNTVGVNLGFNHLIDELRNATNPASGLPLELQLKYSSLPQVSVPQAVERVAAINAWREAQKVAASEKLANNAATVLHKEYAENNPKGLRWVELKKGEELPEGWTRRQKPGSSQTEWLDPHGRLTEDNLDPRYAALQDALKYEGDTMGHCVGGYCDDVASGKTRIFSLRDAKGQPHTTIEVRPPAEPDGTGDFDLRDFGLNDYEYKDAYHQVGGRYFFDLEQLRGVLPDEVLDAKLYSGNPSIKQIKGKGNKAPNEEYLPFVQDFVKSGKWSDVGDLQNTGLRRTRDAWNDLERQKVLDAGHEVPEYLSRDEITQLGKKVWPGQWGDTNYASGGLVDHTYDPTRVDTLVNDLRAEFGMN